MSEVYINKTLYYERILPSTDASDAVLATQKRLALQDAFKCGDKSRALKALKEYLLSFKKIINNVSSNRTNIILKEQPQFDWFWEKQSWMSTCWQWEHIMIHASLYKLNMSMGIECMKTQKWKEASKYFSDASRYSKTIIMKILPLWSWKTDNTIHLTFEDYWKSKLYYSISMKDLCTLQYGYSTTGISDNNAVKLLNRIESTCNKSVTHWVLKNSISLMNWARVGNAIIHARIFSEEDEYGKALGLLNNWESLYEKLVISDRLNAVMECFVVQLNIIKENQSDWITSNNNIHYKAIELPELKSKYHEKNDIINTIKCF